MTKKTFPLGVFVSAALLISAAPVHADIVLNKSILNFEAGKDMRSDVSVTNTGNETAYVQVVPYLVKNPGTAQENREKITDPAKAGLLVSPSKMAIAPGTRKVVRFVNLKTNRTDEGIYRVAITPVSPPVQAEQTGLKVNVGYEVLVLAQPAEKDVNLVAQREGKTLTLTNRGNVNVYLRGGRQCPDGADAEACASLQDKRLYPGNVFTVELPSEGPVEYSVAQGSDMKVKRIP